MTKQLKSAFSILLTLAMLISVMPSEKVSAASVFDAEISVFNADGTSTGIVDSSITDVKTQLLGDNWYYTHYEGVTNLGVTNETNGPTNTAVSQNLARVAKFSEVDSGIMFSWDEDVTVKRLDLWILNDGGIKDYEIQISSDGTDWEEPAFISGTFDAPYSGKLSDHFMTLALYYPIVFENKVETQYLRFVIKSFIDEQNPVAYISEAVIRDTNDVNLSKLDFYTSSGGNRMNSPFMWGFTLSQNNENSTNVAVNSSTNSGKIWPCWGSGSKLNVTADATDGIWIANSFYRSKVKVNRVGFNISGEGTVKEFEVWATPSGGQAAIWSANPSLPSKSGLWTKIATIKCNVTKDTDADNGVLFDIPYPINANGYLIRIPVDKFEGTVALSSLVMQSVSDKEDLSDFAAAIKLILENTKVNDDKDNINLTSTFEYKNNNYEIAWECASELVNIENGNISYHEEEEEVILKALINAESDSDTCYYVEKTLILPPRENKCTITAVSGVEFESGEDEKILNDGFFFSSYDANETSFEEEKEKFAKITTGSEIEYEWIVADSKKRLDLWVYPQGAINEYEIYTSSDGALWEILKDGAISENVKENEDTSSASYYPILFDSVNTKHMKLVIKSLSENVTEAYISETAFSKTNNINLNASPKGAEGKEKAYSHYTKGYIVSNVSSLDTSFVKNNTAVWPIDENGEEIGVSTNGTVLWYASSFLGNCVNINKVTVQILNGTAKEVELLCAAGDEAGFDNSSSSLPACPDTLAEYKSVATIKGNFSIDNPAVIDIVNAPLSRHWLIKFKSGSSDLSIARPEFYIEDESEISALPKIAAEIFDTLTTDTGERDSAKAKINLFTKYNYGGKDYNVSWESTSALLNTETGVISEHEKEDSTVLSAYISDPDNPDLSYSVEKKFTLIGMMVVSFFDKNGNKTKDTILTDDFTYCSFNQRSLDAPKNAAYNLDKFLHIPEEGAGFEFYWEKPKKLKRLEMWSWPVDSILEYDILVSTDGQNWTTHYSGTNEDRYADNPQNRPADESDSAGKAYFSPIVFDSPTEEIKYVRFVVKKLRDTEQGAYVSEAYFYETNDINFAAMGTIPGTEKGDRGESKYMQPFYTGDTAGNDAAFRKHEYRIWPYFSTGSADVLKVKEGDLLWYASSFQGNPVAINKASIKISAGEVREYEILYPATSNTGIKWAEYPTRPDTVASWVTVARVSGKFGAGETSEIHFDNKHASQWWMIKVTEATENLRISGVGFYKIGEYELNSSSFVLDNVFDGVEDTAIDNVVKDKFTLPSSLTRNGKEYAVIWNYDDSIINPDGTVIPSSLDREMTLKAHIGAPEDNYKHVLEKKYFVLGTDEREKTTLYNGENLSVEASKEKEYSSALESGFKFNGKKEVEIDLGEIPQTGKIKLLNEKEEVLSLSFKDGKIIINEGAESEKTTDYVSKIKITLDEESYSLSKESGGSYAAAIYNEKLLTEKAPDTIILCADEAAFNVKSLKITAAGEDIFNEIKEQFTFSKISPSFRATNLNGNLSLIKKVGDVLFTYASGNNALVNKDTGAVNYSLPAEDYIEVTGTSASTGESFTKKYTLLIGRDNVFGNAKASSPNSGKDGAEGAAIVDGTIETDFVTDSKNWRVSIDLKEVKSFNKLRIYEADTEAKIQKYTVTVSDNNVDFTEVFSQDTLLSGENVTIPYTEARFVRINFVSANGATGIKEICAYNEMSPQEKLSYDFNVLTKNLKVENGSIIPKNGKFGTQFSLVSDNSAVTFTETDDKKNWKVVVLNSSFEANVKITLRANLSGAQMQTKDYSIILFADTNLNDNVIAPDDPSGLGGGGGGGSSGGGGGGVSSNSVAITPDAEAMENATKVNELTNHWGANEIKTLVLRGIVQGDGNSLNLTKTVTRAEFCKMIVTGFGYEVKEHKGTFADVNSDDWFAPFAQTAYEYGIMTGDSNGFRGNDTISRQEMAVVLVNALKSYLPELKAEEGIEFSDNGNIAPWASDAVKIASSLKILTGYETGDFKPEKNLQRDEAMVVIYRVLSHVGK